MPAAWLPLLAISAAAPEAWLDAQSSGTAGCVDAAVLAARADELLGPSPSRPATRVTLEATPLASEWAVQIDVESASTTVHRRLRGRDCQVLTDAAALIVAVHVDAVAVAEQIEAMSAPERPVDIETPPPAVRPAPEPAPAPEPVTPAQWPRPSSGPAVSRDVSPPPRPPPRASLATSVAGELGVLPRAAARFELTAGLLWPHLRAELGAAASVGPDAAPALDGRAGGRFRSFAGLVRACGVVGQGRLEVPLCAGLELGDLRARATDRPTTATIDALWVAVTGGVRPLWVITDNVALGPTIDLVVPLRRHRFSIDAQRVHAVAPVAARLGVGVQVRLP